MLKNIVKAILDKDPVEKSAQPAPVVKESPSRLRRLRRPGASSLFNTDKRKNSPIFNRTRTRIRGSSRTTSTTPTTTTTAQSIPKEEDENNFIETAAGEKRSRIPSFRNRLRPRLRQRPRLPFRPKIQEADDEDDGDIEEMMKALKMESMLKKEFDKFLEGKLPQKRPRFRPSGTGLRDRSKIRNSILRSRFRTTTPEEEEETTTFNLILEDHTTEESTTTSTTTTTTTTMPTTTTRITTTIPTTTTTRTTIRVTPATAEFTTFPESIFIPPVRPIPPVPSNIIDPLEGDDEQFEYVYYEYYYDYEYEDEDDPLEAPRAFVDLSQDKSPRPTGFSVAQA